MDYRALLDLEKKPPKTNPSSLEEKEDKSVRLKQTVNTEKPRKTETPKTGLPKKPKPQLSESLKVVNPENVEPRNPENQKPERYSTMLRKDMIKRVKRYAVQEDIDDYEVVEKAL